MVVRFIMSLRATQVVVEATWVQFIVSTVFLALTVVILTLIL
jgi:hypothetical protein